MAHIVTKNLSPHAALNNNVPDAIWDPSRCPDVSFLRPIGCKGTMTILVKQERPKKSEPRGRNIILVGYEPSRKCYRVWDPETDLIHVTGDVGFEETTFPLKQDTLGSGQLKSALPTVHPDGERGALDAPLTFLDHYGSDDSPAPPSPISDSNHFNVLNVEDGEDLSEDELAYLPPSPPPAPRMQPSAPRPSRIRDVKIAPPAQPIFEEAQPSRERSESPDPLDILPQSADLPLFHSNLDDPFVSNFANPFDGDTLTKDHFLSDPIVAFQAAAESLLGDDALFTLPTTTDPINVAEALKTLQARHWQQAIDEEIAALERLGCWEKVKPTNVPAGRRAIGSKFVLKAKKNSKGIVVRYKARLVAQGFSQREGIDFKETFAPVAKFTSIRLLLALAAKHGYEVQQADVDSAFVQADLHSSEVVYMNVPLGMRNRPEYADTVLRLRKTLYGLKQSARAWNHRVHADLVGLGYVCTRTDACIYVKEISKGRFSYITLYVDDCLFVGPSSLEIAAAKHLLHTLYGIKDLGNAEFIIGLQIIRDKGGIFVSQKSYGEAVLARFGMADCRPLSTPMEPNLQLQKSTAPVDFCLKRRYLQAIGSLMYAMLGTRPDLCHAVGYLSRFSDNPTHAHWNTIIHVFRYLAGTLDYGLYYTNGTSPTHGFSAYSDTDWASCINTSRSTMGYVFTLSGAAISWSSRLQTRVAKSSTDAEYIGLSNTSSEAIHLDQQLAEVREPLGHPFIINGDNQGAIALSKEARFHNSMKCVRLSEHLVRELVEEKTVIVNYIPTQDMVADIMTKALPRPAFEEFRAAMGIQHQPSL